MKKTCLLLLAAPLCGLLNKSQAAAYAVNFDSATAAVVATEYGVSPGNWSNTSGQSGSAIGLTGLAGATVSWSSSNTWNNATAATNAAKGYLDDGQTTPGVGATITLSGLLAALQGVEPTATGYTLQLLYSSGDGTSFLPSSLNGVPGVFTSGPDDGANVPKVELSTISGVQTGNALINGGIRDTTGGLNKRGSIAAVIITSVPEPTTAAFGLTALVGLLARRRR